MRKILLQYSKPKSKKKKKQKSENKVSGIDNENLVLSIEETKVQKLIQQKIIGRKIRIYKKLFLIKNVIQDITTNTAIKKDKVKYKKDEKQKRIIVETWT